MHTTANYQRSGSRETLAARESAKTRRAAMLLRLTEELRGHVLIYLDPWTLFRASLAASNMVPAEVITKHAAELQHLQPEVEPPLTLNLREAQFLEAHFGSFKTKLAALFWSFHLFQCF